MKNAWNPTNFSTTRFPELGYRKDGPNLWRIVDTATCAAIGPVYRTQAELLGDLARYAKDYGCAT